MDLGDLLADQPKAHEYQGNLFVYSLARPILEFMDSVINERSRTLETGVGLTTCLFALKGACHVCICPNTAEVGRIIAYCRQHGISTDRVDFRIGCSEHVLPKMADWQFDLVLIDGCHGFPIPFMDWFYTADKLAVGGYLIVDDLQLWTGRTLKEFLLCETEWQLVEPSNEKTAVFKKVSHYKPGKEWTEQMYLRRIPEPSNWVKAKELLRQGKLLTLVGKTVKKVLRG